MGLRGAGGVKNFSVGIWDGTPSTARSSYYYELTCCTENSVDPDQLASEEAIRSGSTLFKIEFSIWSHNFSKKFKYCFSTVKKKPSDLDLHCLQELISGSIMFSKKSIYHMTSRLGVK